MKQRNAFSVSDLQSQANAAAVRFQSHLNRLIISKAKQKIHRHDAADFSFENL